MKLDIFLHKIYFDPESTTSFSSVNKLYKSAKSIFPNVRIEYIKDWLYAQDVYTLHKPIKKNFKRNRIVVQGIDHQWQVDLADVTTLSESNNVWLNQSNWMVELVKLGGNPLRLCLVESVKLGGNPLRLHCMPGRIGQIGWKSIEITLYACLVELVKLGGIH